MPSTSQAQQRFMCGVCTGSITPPKGMTRAQACEFCHATHNVNALPRRARIEKKGTRARRGH